MINFFQTEHTGSFTNDEIFAACHKENPPTRIAEIFLIIDTGPPICQPDAGKIFTAATSLFVSSLPVFMPMRVSSHAFAPIYLVTMIPALLIFAFFAAIYATRHIKSRKFTITFTVIALIYAVACVVLYCIFVPSGSFGLAPKIIASIMTLAAEISAASFVMRSDEYNEKLGEVAEVRNFILSTSRSDMEKIVEKNPYIYYKFLPYALLLRIGIPWSDKFKGLTLSAPS